MRPLPAFLVGIALLLFFGLGGAVCVSCLDDCKSRAPGHWIVVGKVWSSGKCLDRGRS